MNWKEIKRAENGPIAGAKIGILVEGDYFEEEIWYYCFRFREAGADLHFLSRLWGQEKLTFEGHEHKLPFVCDESFENMSDQELRSYAAVLIPSGIVSDRLRYTQDVTKVAPAVDFLRRVFGEKSVLKGIICHGMWLVSPAKDLVQDRPVTAHNNLIWDVRNMGAKYVDQDIVVNDDLVTGRTGEHCHFFAAKVIELVAERRKR
jgi:protease I